MIPLLWRQDPVIVGVLDRRGGPAEGPVGRVAVRLWEIARASDRGRDTLDRAGGPDRRDNRLADYQV